jgi:DHA2 family multidrug resistance protein
MVRPMVEKAALVQAINDAWLVIGALTALALVLVVFVRHSSAKAEGSIAACH